MDSVINRLRNTVTTVTSTVSQLSVVLPGNPVTREFEVTQHVASGGPGIGLEALILGIQLIVQIIHAITFSLF